MWKATAVLRSERSLLRKPTLTTLDKLCSMVPKAGRAPLSVPHLSMVTLTHAHLRLGKDLAGCLQLPVVLQASFAVGIGKLETLKVTVSPFSVTLAE